MRVRSVLKFGFIELGQEGFDLLNLIPVANEDGVGSFNDYQILNSAKSDSA
jgi:hypothetical protein